MDEEDSPFSIDVAREYAGLALEEAALRDAVVRTLRRFDRRAARISVAIVDDERIAQLNEQFLGHTGPTDCITFDLADSDRDGIEGEIVISGETALREAVHRDHAPYAEALLYVIHGTLHLLGLDDTTEQQAARMHAIENDVLSDMGIGPLYTVEQA